MGEFAAVILVDTAGRVLLQERDEHPVIAPEQWSFCGGHVEPGEGLLAAAVRELAEETEVVLDPADLVEFGVFDVHHSDTGTDDRLAVFAAAVDLTDDDVVCHEGRQIVFVEPEAARALDLSESAARFLPLFLDSATYAELRGGGVAETADSLRTP